VITVCSDADENCPVFPGITKRWHHGFPDPSKVTGPEEEKLEKVRRIRDAIKDWLLHPPEGGFSYKAVLEKE